MLLVNASRGLSKVHGYGLIAREFIPKGTKVWEFMPGFDVAIPEADLEKLSPAARQQVVYWAFFNLNTRTFVLSSDDDRFTNHADEPNARCVGDVTIAASDIHPGDEIFNDYRELVVVHFQAGMSYGVEVLQTER